MKKRLLAMLLVLMMVVSLLPTGALADGDIWDGYGTFSYHITDSDLQAMVDAYNTTGASSGVDSVSITFDEDYSLGGQKTFLFRNGYTIGLSNTSKSVQPDDIDCLTITLINGTVLPVPGDKLDWTWVNTSPKRYDLRLKNSDKSTVTFYYQPGGSYTYEEYTKVEVDSGTALNELMPADPTDLGGYKFVGWEIGSFNGNGREFHADTIVSENIAVYARKISVRGGTEVNVINLENSIYSNAYEHFSTESLEITGIALNGGGKSTNPDYDIDLIGETGVDTGWRDDNSYYYIHNEENHTPPEGGHYWNDRVDPYELDSITIFTTAGNYNIPRDELDVRVKLDTKVEIYLREATEPVTPVEPDPQPDPKPETNPDVSNVSVVVDCTANNEHDKTVDIIEGSYTFNRAWDGEQWTCTVEIIPNSYVTDDTHTLDPESQTGELLYVYADNSWQYVGGSTPTVTFTVKCETTEPDPGPDEPDVNGLLKNAILVDCVGTADHTSVRFFTPLSHSVVKNVTANGDGTYSYVISISATAYLNNCNTHNFDVTHKLADKQDETVEVTFTWEDGEWTCPYKNGDELRIYVTCDSDEPETPVKTDYLAGFFVLMPEKMTEDFQPGDVYPTDSYYPNDKRDKVTTASNKEGEVDDTTGYIGYLTEEGYKYFLAQANVSDYDELTDVVRVAIPADKVDDYLIVPEGSELGTVWTKYLADSTHQLVCYQMNNSTLGANWPTITTKNGTQYDTHDGYTFHVDCYVEGVDVAVTYDANYEGGTVYKHETVNDQPIKSGDSYTVLDIDDTGITRDGYEFVGWSTSKSGTPLVTEINPLMTDTILYAVWKETEEPEQPTVYEIYVTVHNGTATFYGSEVTSSILAAEGEDITITFTPDEGYTLDYATIDGGTLLIPDGGVYTLKQVDSDHTIEVFYAKDENGGGEDGDEPDGTPDYRQVFVKYVAADENGVVTPSFDTFDLDVDENGKVMTDVALALSGTATANTDATFAYWTIEGPGYDDFGAYSYEAALSSKDFTGYIAGETYTFTAYFNGPVVKPEEPNVYDIYVTVHNGTATFYGSEVTSSIPAAEGEDITITFTPDEGYTLDYATIDGGTLLIPDGGVYTLKQVDSDHTIEVFYAKDENGGGEDGDEPDGTPDYRQVFVKYVAADENGVVTPSFDTFDLDVDENGKVMTDVALALSGTATANTDASFGYWTIEGSGYDGGTYSFEADLENENFSGYLPGETYTFTAYFNGPVVKPELKPYHINVEVVNGTAEFKETNIGANSVINVYPIKDDNKNVEITFVPTDGYVFDAAYVDDESITLSEDNSYTFTEVTADVTIKVLFKQDSVPITPVTPMPTPGEISDLIKDSITVDCVNGEVAHADKVYGLLDGSLVNVEKTGDTSIKVTLDATVYQARYNTDTETKHSLADGQSATVTFALNYVDQKWRVAEGELPITIKVVCETPVEPDPDITGFSKTLVKDRNLYVYQGLAYPTFYRSSVIVDEGDGVTLLYKITVTGTPGTEFTVRDDSADFAQTGEIPDSGETSFYVAKTFSWRDVRYAGDTLDNTASVSVDGETVKTDTERVPVDIDWDFNVPDIDDDDDDDDEDDEVFVPNWLNTEDHYSYIVGYEDGTIKPNNNITRAEVATIFYRLLTDSSRERWYTDSNSFTDVADDSWYNEPVSTLSRMGIINGYEDGSFKPNAPITRAEFTAIATRFFDYSARYDGAFYDVSAGSWYADYIQAAVDMGLVEGYPDGGVHPGSNITRAEAVTIVNRVLNRVPHEDHLLSTRVMNTWPDNKPGAWYYADMQEATNSHDYDWTRVNGKLVEDWTNKLADPNW